MCFLFSLVILELYCLAFAASHLGLETIEHEDELGISNSMATAIKRFPTLIIIFIICLVVACFVTHLFYYHMKIIWISETTYENLKGHYKNTLFNPYKKRCISSFYDIFCTRRPQKVFDLREPKPK